MAQDLMNQREIHVERLVRSGDEKLSMQLRGAIAAFDLILSLPETVEKWKQAK